MPTKIPRPLNYHGYGSSRNLFKIFFMTLNEYFVDGCRYQAQN